MRRVTDGRSGLIAATLVVLVAGMGLSNHAALPPPDYCSLKGIQGKTLDQAVGVISRIPEFHDCQRFVEDGAFKATYAIYATEAMATFTWNNEYKLVAVIYAPEAPYSPLGIVQGWNCLFFGLQTSLQDAVMMRETESACYPVVKDLPDSVGVRGFEQQDLNVREKHPTGFEPADFPPAARWEWDPRNAQYAIGVRCGPAWCRVYKLSAPIEDYTVKNAAATNKRKRRIGEIPGWYDEQRLATMRNRQLVPGPVAVVFADPNLDRDPKLYDSTWQSVAYVALSQADPIYERKYRFVATPFGNQVDLTGLNVVALCRGDACEIPQSQRSRVAQCQKATAPSDKWWVRTGPPTANPGNPDDWEYKCATRYGHESEPVPIPIPPAVRWRWSDKDETIWVRCGQGCCEVDQ